MKKLLTLLCLVAFPSLAAPVHPDVVIGALESGNKTSVIGCDHVKTFNTSSSGLSELVTVVTGQSIYICSYGFFAGGTTAAKLIYGTKASTACDTGATDITPAMPFTTGTNFSYDNPFYNGMGAPASNEICLNNGSAAQITGFITYTQF